MTSSSYKADFLTSSFFCFYDQLSHDASSLEESTQALKLAKSQRDEAQKDLSFMKRELRTLRGFIKEQKDRIRLVSTHWFFGTTIFQPQLWLRGGCRGKIERAQKKLTRAQDSDLPRLQLSINEIEGQRLPQLQADVDRQLERFDFSANAASERQMMRERVFAQHPSPLLLTLQQQETNLQNQIQNTEREAQNLDDVISKLFMGEQQYESAKNSLERALRHNVKFRQAKKEEIPIPKPREILRSRGHRNMSETRVPNGTRVIIIDNDDGGKDLFHIGKDGEIISTNFPCPNGCGCLVTWHETHCCNACCAGKDAAGCNHHGKRCDRKPIHTQLGTEKKLRDRERAIQARKDAIAHENDSCNRLFTQGRKEAKQAERAIKQALASIPISVRERYVVVCRDLMENAHVPTSPPPSGAGSTTARVRESGLEQEITNVTQAQTATAQQLSTVQQLQSQVRQDGQGLSQELHSVKSTMEGEQNRIFNELRASVMEKERENEFNIPANNNSNGSSSIINNNNNNNHDNSNNDACGCGSSKMNNGDVYNSSGSNSSHHCSSSSSSTNNIGVPASMYVPLAPPPAFAPHAPPEAVPVPVAAQVEPSAPLEQHVVNYPRFGN